MLPQLRAYTLFLISEFMCTQVYRYPPRLNYSFFSAFLLSTHWVYKEATVSPKLTQRVSDTPQHTAAAQTVLGLQDATPGLSHMITG